MQGLLTFLKERRGTTKHNEEGFTLLELMIVVIIIGLLVAIVIPVFSTQQKSAMDASVKSDIKNTVTVLVTEATKNSGRFLTYVPNSVTVSEDNHIYIDPAKSGPQRLCLVGYNKKNPDIYYYYDSNIGKVTSTPCTALPASSASFSSAASSDLKSKRALVVYHAQANPEVAATQLKSFGYGTVDSINAIGYLNSTDKAVSQYDLVFIYYSFWGTPSDVSNKTQTYYNNGGLVIQDGNDTNVGGNPFMKTTVQSASGSDYSPTYKTAGLSPAFPFTFRDVGFGSDSSWKCVTELQGNAVSLATSQQNGNTCSTLFAATNGSGRWVYMSYFTSRAEITGVAGASLTWLTQK
jgi:prepilin-type N-terminal cleavage/methylation domain-containing protein